MGKLNKENLWMPPKRWITVPDTDGLYAKTRKAYEVLEEKVF